MRSRLIYIVLFLAVMAGIMGPVIYSGKLKERSQVGEGPAAGEAYKSRTEAETPPESAAGGGTVSDRPSGLREDNGPPGGAGAGREDSPAGSAGQAGGPPPEQKPDSSPPVGAKAGGFAVSIAVMGMDDKLLFGPREVALTGKNGWGTTALGALHATGLPYTVSSRWPGFVEAVAGQHNKGQSGWMYKVNDEIPLVAAGQKPVKDGDRVIWWYSKSMGAPVPDWNELNKR